MGGARRGRDAPARAGCPPARGELAAPAAAPAQRAAPAAGGAGGRATCTACQSSRRSPQPGARATTRVHAAARRSRSTAAPRHRAVQRAMPRPAACSGPCRELRGVLRGCCYARAQPRTHRRVELQAKQLAGQAVEAQLVAAEVAQPAAQDGLQRTCNKPLQRGPPALGAGRGPGRGTARARVWPYDPYVRRTIIRRSGARSPASACC